VGDGRPLQVIASTVQVPVTLIDLGGVPASEREEESQRQSRASARRPFDLARGPLLRFRVWRLAEREHVLLVTMHHIIADGWSVGIVMRDLATLYQRYAGSDAVPLTPSPIQYADIAHWQRHWRRDAALRTQFEYWKRELRGPLPTLALPTDRPRRRSMRRRTDREPVELPRALFEALTAMSHREGGTVFMAVIAAFKMLLYGCTGERDVRVATFLANRQRSETEEVVGPLADMVILRTDLGDNPPCREILRRVRATIVRAYMHQEFPFEELAQILERERGLTRATLSPALVVWQSTSSMLARFGGPPLSFQEMDQSWLAPEVTVTTFDVILQLREHARGLGGSWIYNPELFDATTVRRLIGDLRDLLEMLVTEPERRLATLPIGRR
jgi:hypothetical protein